MRYVLIVMALTVFVLGIVCLLVPRFRSDGEHQIEVGGHRFHSTSAGIILIMGGTGLALFMFVAGNARGNPSAAEPGPIPPPPTDTAPSNSPAPKPSVSRPPSRAPTPAPTPSETPSGPPWTAVNNGLGLIIEDVVVSPELGNRLIFTIRLENNSKHNIAVPVAGVLAVDNNQHSYAADASNSSLPLEADERGLSSYSNGPFSAGTHRKGTVSLAEPLIPGAQTLQVRFTVAYIASSSINTTHFTVAADITVPPGPAP